MFGKFLHKSTAKPIGLYSMSADQYNDYIRNVVYPNMRRELEDWVTDNVERWDVEKSKPFRDNLELISVDFRVSLLQSVCHTPFLAWLAQQLPDTVTLFSDLNGKYRVKIRHIGTTFKESVHISRKYLESKD